MNLTGADYRHCLRTLLYTRHGSIVACVIVLVKFPEACLEIWLSKRNCIPLNLGNGSFFSWTKFQNQFTCPVIVSSGAQIAPNPQSSLSAVSKYDLTLPLQQIPISQQTERGGSPDEVFIPPQMTPKAQHEWINSACLATFFIVQRSYNLGGFERKCSLPHFPINSCIVVSPWVAQLNFSIPPNHMVCVYKWSRHVTGFETDKPFRLACRTLWYWIWEQIVGLPEDHHLMIC